MDAAEIRQRLRSGEELAFLDVREEGPYSRAQPLFAVNLPLGRLELEIRRLVPRGNAPVALFDDGGGEAERAAVVLDTLGYTDVSIVPGGLNGWRAAGGEIFRDVNVPSKAFGEWVEAHRHTPMIDAIELKVLLDRKADVVVLDSRPWGEYRRMTIPTSIDCPGAELVLRARDLAPSPDTLVVVNCAGRTRSIIGAQSLINAGLPNPVRALRNGTIGWTLAGLDLDIGAERRAGPPGPKALAWAIEAAAGVAARAEVRVINAAGLARFEAESAERGLFKFDVRQPEEHAAGHVAGFFNAPGGQLVQATDEYVGLRGARIVLADDDGVRARMTASWLRQLGWSEVFVLDQSLADRIGGRGVWQAPSPLPAGPLPLITASQLSRGLPAGDAAVLDLAPSPVHTVGHIPGAWFAIRSHFASDLENLPGSGPVVLASPDGKQAGFAFADARALTSRPLAVLDGGTEAWIASGLPLETGIERALSPVDDVYRRPYEGIDNAQEAMQAYIEWELGLVEQIRRDGTATFRPI